MDKDTSVSIITPHNLGDIENNHYVLAVKDDAATQHSASYLTLSDTHTLTHQVADSQKITPSCHPSNPSKNPCGGRKYDQLTQDIVSTLKHHTLLSPLSARESADVDEAWQAFQANFPRGSTWANSIQLTQATNCLGDVYGFTTRPSGNSLFCDCGKTHKQTKDKKSLFTLGLNHDQEKQ